jgi:hypothetical protein
MPRLSRGGRARSQGASRGTRWLIAVLAGVGAAVMPARRASRMNVLEALQYE